ncbi:YczE/YyaS/YitT family protein [Niallia sp. 03133]|uniref:YczE/YyaS/YitT family protein n=1 Tax=Niallia sp. 03133 TaxID=3458060 RepID=UPI004044C6A0
MSENVDKQRTKSEIIIRSILALIGVAILAIGATFCKVGNVGLDPFTALNIGISKIIGLSLGSSQLGANVIIIVVVLLLDRKRIGIGTIINMVCAGFMIDWFSNLYTFLFDYQPTLLTKIVNGILGLLFFTLGTSIYMTAKVGVAPYDALAPIASKRLHIKYKFCRMVQDIGFMVGALIAGGPIGPATIIISFFAGPLITFWDNKFSKNLVETFVEFGKHPSGKSIGQGIDTAGKYTYNLVKYSYNQTVITQEKLSDYSDEQLEQQVKQTRRTLNHMKTAFKHTVTQYGMLKKEERKREREAKEQLSSTENSAAPDERTSKQNSDPTHQ